MILILKPIYIYKVWGDSKQLAKNGFKNLKPNTGEVYVMSCLKNNESIIINDKFKGISLKQVYEENWELFFEKKYDTFPLLLKILSAKSDLSIQAHPNNEYAYKHENKSLGKQESWYILDCKENSTIIYGHNAKNRSELKKYINENSWNKLVTPQKIFKGSVFDISPGTVHAIRANTLIYEIQQSSMITYRLYDYDRLDHGKLRELHTNQAKNVIYCPQKLKTKKAVKINTINNKVEIIKNIYYKTEKLILNDKYLIKTIKSFKVVTCIEGECKIENYKFKKGESFLLLKDNKSYISGNAVFLISSLK